MRATIGTGTMAQGKQPPVDIETPPVQYSAQAWIRELIICGLWGACADAARAAAQTCVSWSGRAAARQRPVRLIRGRMATGAGTGEWLASAVSVRRQPGGGRFPHHMDPSGSTPYPGPSRLAGLPGQHLQGWAQRPPRDGRREHIRRSALERDHATQSSRPSVSDTSTIRAKRAQSEGLNRNH